MASSLVSWHGQAWVCDSARSRKPFSLSLSGGVLFRLEGITEQVLAGSETCPEPTRGRFGGAWEELPLQLRGGTQLCIHTSTGVYSHAGIPQNSQSTGDCSDTGSVLVTLRPRRFPAQPSALRSRCCQGEQNSVLFLTWLSREKEEGVSCSARST